MGVLEAVGNTPLVEIGKINPLRDKVRVLAKLEGANPCGSVKDRIAVKMVRMGIESGQLTPDKTVLEATSGNTGIGLAMVCAALGYRLVLCMPECVSMERRSVLNALSAEIVLTPSEQGTDGAIQKALEIMEQAPDRYYMPNQFENPYNFLAHYETTGPEVWAQTKGEVSAFVAGMGTTGTLMGVSRFLKEQDAKIEVIGVEPMEGHHIQGLKNMKESKCPGIYNTSRLDELIYANDDQAFEMARELAVKEGLFVGMSSGAALHGALTLARDMPAGSTVVTLFPDRGDRYLSTHLFASVCAKCPP
ncbi:MAG TPA: cysteine synthase family protein [bacterium]|nr:cysteine synthase family protein [bacterium]